MKKLELTPRRWLLVLHLLFSAVMFGVTVAFLVLSITAARTNDAGVFQACYTGMHIMSGTVVPGSTVSTLVTGIALSVLTNWGLFRFHWIIAKEALTLLSIALGPIGMYVWTLKAAGLAEAYGLQALHDPAFAANSAQLWTGISLQLASLAAMFILSVFKPWGQRKRRSRLKPAS